MGIKQNYDRVMKNHFANNFNDFSDTERKIAEIWRDVLCLSKKQFEELNKDSDFFDLLPSWCATFEINSVNRDINQMFHIPIDLISISENSTIKELAARIDRFQDDKHKS
ncbi:MAG: acyl carrier protein [Hydrococcus sp. RM1_1_31]|nr:acyl carrier protein [Hydrococcus sp. RM1_1_31]